MPPSARVTAGRKTQDSPPLLSTPLITLIANELSDPLTLIGACDASRQQLSRKLRIAALAAVRLGHRACHAVWGPSNSGKEDIVDDTTRSLRRTEGCCVLCFDGDVLQTDEDALRVCAVELDAFLSSSASVKLRQKSTVFRQRTFEFAKYMKGDHLMSIQHAEIPDAAPMEGASQLFTSIRSRDGEELMVHATKKRRIEAAERHNTGLQVSKRAHNGVESESQPQHSIGGVGAFTALHESLLLMLRNGAGLVISIRNVARFGVWCDRMMYLLSGLMHDADEGGCGMALLLTSCTPDLRHTEKRLSSRLTCEMWYAKPPLASFHQVFERIFLNVGKVVDAELRAVSSKSDEHQSLLAELSKKGKRQTQQTTAPSGVRTRARKTLATSERDCTVDVEAVGRIQEVTEELQELRRRLSSLRQASEVIALWQACDLCTSEATCLARMNKVLGTPDVLLSCATRGHVWEDVASAVLLFVRKLEHRQQVAIIDEGTVKKTSPQDVEDGMVRLYKSGATFADLLDGALLVRLGYASREMMLLLAFVTMRAESGTYRTLEDLVHDIASSMASSAAIKNTVLSNYACAFDQLQRLGILCSNESSGAVTLKRDVFACKLFLQDVLASETLWEDAGLALNERHKLSQVLR